MGKLRSNWIGQGTTSGSSLVIPIPNNYNERVWIIEQIAVNYAKAGDAATVSIILNGVLYSGPAQMIPVTSGLGQTFGGQPYLHLEVDDKLEVHIDGATNGVLVTIQVQSRIVGYDHDDLEGRF